MIDSWLTYDAHKRYEVQIICRELTNIFSNLTRLQLPVKRFPLAKSRFLRYVDFRIVKYLVEQIRTLTNPVLNPHDPFANLHCVFARALTGRRCRLVPTVHTASWKLPTNRIKRSGLFFLERYALQRADHIITVSGYVKSELENLGIPNGRITVVWNSIEPIENIPEEKEKQCCAAALGTERRRRVIGFAGRLSPEKGFDDLLTAINLLPKEVRDDLCVLVAGDSSNMESIRAKVRQMGLENRVHFLGFLRNMGTFYAALDVLVLPSKIEGLPIVLLEAMNYGLPVIATRVGGTPEVVRDGVTGWLVRAGDPAFLASAISQACSNPAELFRRGQEGRARVLNHFTLERMANQIEVVLEQFANAY